jgi:ComF family protein
MKIPAPIATIARAIRYWCAPSFCAYCKQFLNPSALLCAECLDVIKPVVSYTIDITPTKSMKILAISDYQEPLRSLIIAKTWSDYLASHQLGELMWKHTYIRHTPVDFFIPIPLHTTRYLYRGFNQAHEMATVLAHHSGKPVTNILTRTKRTVFQSTLTHTQRHENVKNVFQLTVANPADYHNKHLVLVDDLATTGATLKTAAKELLKLKPASITAVVACRVI